MTQDEQLTVDLWLLDALLTGHDPLSGVHPGRTMTMEGFVSFQSNYMLSDQRGCIHYSLSEGNLILNTGTEDVHLLFFSRPAEGIRRRIIKRIKTYQDRVERVTK